MNEFINNITIVTENSSDNFFQPKHIIKRIKDNEKRDHRIYVNLERGMRKVETVYNNKRYKNEKERLFLEIFSKLHLGKRCVENSFHRGYALFDANEKVICFYELDDNEFWVNNYSVWRMFLLRLIMNQQGIKTFIVDMLRKYFRIHTNPDIVDNTDFYHS